jgi:hypothetical protein
MRTSKHAQAHVDSYCSHYLAQLTRLQQLYRASFLVEILVARTGSNFGLGRFKRGILEIISDPLRFNVDERVHHTHGMAANVVYYEAASLCCPLASRSAQREHIAIHSNVCYIAGRKALDLFAPPVLVRTNSTVMNEVRIDVNA